MKLANLFELQSIDSKLDAYQTELAAIQAQIGRDSSVQNANQTVLSMQSEVELNQRELNLLADEVERQKIKLAQSDAMLYSGKVQNPKELQDLQHEIQYLKNKIADLEDTQLNQMIKLEEIQKSHQAAKTSLNTIASQFATNQSQLNARKEAIQLDFEKLHRKREVVLSSIEPELIARYENLRKRKNGLAIAALENDACSACGTQLTPSERQEVRLTSKLFFCPTCGRILYHN
ncbi:MAG TPA: C4-type zinc ribbon domain-containing protein [Anaerolineaceae bacterium]|jgi:predicted  nucleic acid-binding Zn-ribbon protein|nr:C4-type zinc ribbon domain-containing protein [Anaerolineaceae bacterium]